jgi:hypothetical protein
MIRPKIVHLSEEHRSGLAEMLCEAGNGFAVTAEWPFNPKRSLVALHNGEVVGFISIWHDGQPSAWVDSLVVKQKYQGIGIFLCLAAEALALQLGARYIRALAYRDEWTQHLLRAGFVSVGKYEVLEKGY